MPKERKNSQMFFILHRREQKLFNIRMKFCQPHFLLCVGEIDTHLCTRWDNVELGIEGIYPVNNVVKSRKSKRSVTLILSKSVIAEIIKGEKKKIWVLNKKRTLEWCIYYLPAISWKVLVIMKSVWFMARRSAENWQEKWYFSSNFFQ